MYSCVCTHTDAEVPDLSAAKFRPELNFIMKNLVKTVLEYSCITACTHEGLKVPPNAADGLVVSYIDLPLV